MAKRRSFSFSLAWLFVALTWISIVLGFTAVWGQFTLPYTMAITGAMVGVLIGKILIGREQDWSRHWLRHPRLYGATMAFASVGMFAGRALESIGPNRPTGFVWIFGGIALSGLLGIVIGLALRGELWNNS